MGGGVIGGGVVVGGVIAIFKLHNRELPHLKVSHVLT